MSGKVLIIGCSLMPYTTLRERPNHFAASARRAGDAAAQQIVSDRRVLRSASASRGSSSSWYSSGGEMWMLVMRSRPMVSRIAPMSMPACRTKSPPANQVISAADCPPDRNPPDSDRCRMRGWSVGR